MAKKKEEKGSSEKALRSYQLWSLAVFFPYLLSFLGLASGLWGESLSLSLSLASLRTLALWSLEGSAPEYAEALPFALGIVSLALGAYLALMGARGKRWAPWLSFALYGADTIYGLLLWMPDIPYPLGATEGAILTAMHLLGLSFLCVFLWKYAKLSRLLDEEAKKHGG